MADTLVCHTPPSSSSTAPLYLSPASAATAQPPRHSERRSSHCHRHRPRARPQTIEQADPRASLALDTHHLPLERSKRASVLCGPAPRLACRAWRRLSAVVSRSPSPRRSPSPSPSRLAPSPDSSAPVAAAAAAATSSTACQSTVTSSTACQSTTTNTTTTTTTAITTDTTSTAPPTRRATAPVCRSARSSLLHPGALTSSPAPTATTAPRNMRHSRRISLAAFPPSPLLSSSSHHDAFEPPRGSRHHQDLTDDASPISPTAGAYGMSGSDGPEKPLAASNGLAVHIDLAEPMIFLQGFDHLEGAEHSTSMLRGSLHLRVSKVAKLKSVALRFRGRAETDWPEGIPPRKTEFKDGETVVNHTWTFFNAALPDLGHGADVVRPLKGPIATTREVSPGVSSMQLDHPSRASYLRQESPVSREMKRRSWQPSYHGRSLSRDHHDSLSTAQKGYRVFMPGLYVYNFELPIDSRMPESLDVELGRVKYDLEATVERSGAFRANLMGTKEVTLIRAPADNSLETIEPIAISRDWEDQLHYDIVISGKSFPLGAQIPIAFKLTPLAKVQCHRIKVFVTENIQYFTANKRVHRLEPTRKILLFEKRADSSTSTSTYPGSSVRIISGGGISYDNRDAAALGDESVPHDRSNLLGNLTGDEHTIGPTEMEINVQLPSCQAMSERDKPVRLHFDTTYHNIQVNHWIKIMMRLSRPDATDPNKRRHFEISIDSPINILSCRATQANISLPAYSSPESVTLLTDHLSCGCPGAPRRRNSPTSLFPHTMSMRPPSPEEAGSHRNALNRQSSDESAMSGGAGSARQGSQSALDLALPPPPQAAHISDRAALNRPMHLLRAPSFNPPSFAEIGLDAPPQWASHDPRSSSDTLASHGSGGAAPDYDSTRTNGGSFGGNSNGGNVFTTGDHTMGGQDDALGGDPGASATSVLSPPPKYETLVHDGDGLADYFSRLADEDPDVSMVARMSLPLTPGGRVNRSMDARRDWMPVGLARAQ